MTECEIRSERECLSVEKREKNEEIKDKIRRTIVNRDYVIEREREYKDRRGRKKKVLSLSNMIY